jgi:hypothetical protein
MDLDLYVMSPDGIKQIRLYGSACIRFQSELAHGVRTFCKIEAKISTDVVFRQEGEGVLLVSCEAIGFQGRFELEGQTEEVDGDLTLLLNDKSSGLGIEISILGTEYGEPEPECSNAA